MKKAISIAILAAIAAAWILTGATTNPATWRAPTVSTGATATKIYWTAGSINNGGHAVAVAAGNASVDASQTSCAAPAFSACDFVYANSVGTVAVTTAIATATASGNTLLALVETSAGSVPTSIVLPPQSGTLWLQAAGPTATGFTALTPSAAGTIPLCSAPLPCSGAYIGNAATNNALLTGTFGQATTLTAPDPGAATASLMYINSTTAQNLLTGSFNIGDTSAPTKALNFQTSGATAGTKMTLAMAQTSSRTVTFPDPGGSVNIAYATNPTDGYYFVPPSACGLTLTIGTWAANANGGTSLGVGPFLERVAAGNMVLEGTTTSAANTFQVVCDITPPSRIAANKGLTINTVAYMAGWQTTAPTSTGTAALNSVTYHAAGSVSQGTVAAIGGSITPTGWSHGTPPATTTTGQCYTESLALGTPYNEVTDLTRLTLEYSVAQSAASSTILQICGAIVYYTNYAIQ